MNVPRDYDDEAERLRTHPLLLPKEDESKGLSTVDKNVLKKTTNNNSFAPDVKFTHRTLIRPNVPRINKKQNTRQKSVRQQVTNTIASPLTHRRSVLGDQTSRSPQYQRYLQMLKKGQTEAPARRHERTEAPERTAAPARKVWQRPANTQ